MYEQKIKDFRERAEALVEPVDPEMLLRRGRARRRRRHLTPVAALIACIGIGIAAFGPGEGGSQDDTGPVSDPSDVPTATVKGVLGDTDGVLAPGRYGLEYSIPDGRPDATVELVGDGWQGWSGGAHISNSLGSVSWGLQPYAETIIDRCRPSQSATSRVAAIEQLTRIHGQVTEPPRPASAISLSGTHLQLSLPVDVECGTGTSTSANLMAIWDGPEDPTVTVDVWVLQDGERLLLLTQAVRGNPPAPTLDALHNAMRTLRTSPTV